MRSCALRVAAVGLVRKDMSVAQWDADGGTAEVIVQKGKPPTVTGFTKRSRRFAFIEEVG